MIKYLTLLILSLQLVGCKTKVISIKTNEIYQTKERDGYRYFLKFYNDSTVIETSSIANYTEIDTWFNKEYKNISKGKFYIKNDSLFFYTESKNGTVNYSGKILNKKLILKSESIINGHIGNEIYKLKRIN
jgi:hypothetical protein